jgi:LacI family transcriptional regulator
MDEPRSSDPAPANGAATPAGTGRRGDARATGRPTLRDVAREAHVSFKTVSRVVNGEPFVDAGTVDRVHAAIARLGYRPNEMARRLRRGQGASVLALVISNVANPYYSAMTRATEEEARERGLLLITGSTDDDPERERAVVQTLVERRVDGVLLVTATRQHEHLAQEMRLGMPVVFVDRPPVDIEADTIVPANTEGVREGVHHLVAHGHRRIALLGAGASVDVVTRERAAGYELAHADAGLALDPRLARLEVDTTDGAAVATRELLGLHDPPTAFLGANNRCTVGVLRALRDAGRRCAVVGFDDFELADMLDPPVTVIANDPAEMGRLATRLLCDRIAGDTSPPRRIVLPTTLVVRGSGELGP